MTRRFRLDSATAGEVEQMLHDLCRQVWLHRLDQSPRHAPCSGRDVPRRRPGVGPDVLQDPAIVLLGADYSGRHCRLRWASRSAMPWMRAHSTEAS